MDGFVRVLSFSTVSSRIAHVVMREVHVLLETKFGLHCRQVVKSAQPQLKSTNESVDALEDISPRCFRTQ